MSTTPVTIPPTPPVKVVTTFWADVKSVTNAHYKWVIGAVLGILIVIGFNYVQDIRKELANQQQVIGTLSQQYQQEGKNAIAGNTQAPQEQVDSQAALAFGASMMKYMEEQGAQINSLTSATGQLNSQINALQGNLPKYQPTQQNAAQGVTTLTGYPLEEVRKDGPALASVNLFYDPHQTDPNKAFTGTTWTDYEEQFKAEFGQWEKDPNKGFKSTVTMSRTVLKPDPNNPGKFIAVGTEQIPITGASTVYTPTGILDGQQVVLPRWTGSFGVSDLKGGYSVAGQIDYRLTDRYGIWVGSANGGAMGGVSVRFGAPKP